MPLLSPPVKCAQQSPASSSVSVQILVSVQVHSLFLLLVLSGTTGPLIIGVRLLSFCCGCGAECGASQERGWCREGGGASQGFTAARARGGGTSCVAHADLVRCGGTAVVCAACALKMSAVSSAKCTMV